MRRLQTAWSLPVVALFALVASSGSANAAVLIKTFRCTICVSDAKHPEACKRVKADGQVVVSDDALEGLEGELGQGATIMAVPANGAATPSNGQDRHRRHHIDQELQ